MTAVALKQETDSYWNLVKGAGNEVKIALIKRLTDSLLPAIKFSEEARLYAPETGRYVNDETMQAIAELENNKTPQYRFSSMEDFKNWCEAL